MRHFLIMGLCLWSAAYAAAQTTLYVATTGNDTTGDGSAGNPYLTISNGVFQAAAGDTVLVSGGIYTQTVNIYITKDIIVRGMDAPTGVVITTMSPDVSYSARCVRVSSAGAVFDGFTLEKGYPPQSSAHQYAFGGGILVEAGLVTNCVVRACQARYGGGAALFGPNALMRNCWISNNLCAYGVNRGGGGVVFGDLWGNYGGGNLLDCFVLNNTNLLAASFGGGIYSRSTNGIVSNCLIACNTLVGNAYGGGICLDGPGLLVIDSVVSNNYGGIVGGGICVRDKGYLVVRDTTVTRNLSWYGGGVHSMRTAANGGGILISNCVISYNAATNYHGGGIMDGYLTGATSSGLLEVVNTRIIGNGTNTSRYGGGVFIYTHGTAILDRCEIAGNTLFANYSEGAGIYIGTGSACVVVRNCLIASNRMTGISSTGGGVEISGYQAGGSGPNPFEARVESCTIVGNTATLNYGGINLTNGATAWNTVVVSNQADNAYPDLLGDAVNIERFRHCCGPGLTNAENGNITGPPVLADYAAGDYRLAADSPGVHAGTNQFWMDGAVDLDGRPRRDRFIRQTDMGCYEYVFSGTLFQLQ